MRAARRVGQPAGRGVKRRTAGHARGRADSPGPPGPNPPPPPLPWRGKRPRRSSARSSPSKYPVLSSSHASTLRTAADPGSRCAVPGHGARYATCVGSQHCPDDVPSPSAPLPPSPSCHGTRCPCRTGRQVEHREPFAVSCNHAEDNVEAFCAAHNGLRAREYFGSERTQRAMAIERWPAGEGRRRGPPSQPPRPQHRPARCMNHIIVAAPRRVPPARQSSRGKPLSTTQARGRPQLEIPRSPTPR